ncbi:GNAT family N-acetyltransferase [Paracoccaceae bacterium]|nr:GNAT family N-acetyltransferase [Paracoccaceae bacterium]
MLIIQHANPYHPEITALLEQSYKMMQSLYKTHEDHSLSIDDLCQEDVCFLGAKTKETFIGCAALVLREGYGEIKSMFTDPNHRGNGVGKTLMSAIEAEAIKHKLPHLKLETGALLKEAVVLYAKFGFQTCGPFGEYNDDGVSLFMSKMLIESNKQLQPE